MEETYQTKAIILDRKPFREHDIKADIYSLEKGRMEFVVRGAKKIESKLAGHLEPFCLSNIMIIRGRQLDYIGSAINENAFLNIKNDFNKISIAGQAISIFRKLVKEGEKDEGLFNLLSDFLEALNNYELKIKNYELFFPFFSLKLISSLGHKPQLYNCVVCGEKISPGRNLFDLARGGLVCGQCAPTPNPSPASSNSADRPAASRERGVRLTVSDDCIKVLRLAVMADNDFNKLVKLKINNALSAEAEKIINLFYNYNF